jgi:hypothetical protein
LSEAATKVNTVPARIQYNPPPEPASRLQPPPTKASAGDRRIGRFPSVQLSGSRTPLPHRNPDGLSRDDGTGRQDLHAKSSIGLTGRQAETAHDQGAQQSPECSGRPSWQVALLKDVLEVD